MLSKNKIKFINSLKLKKFRDINSLFVAEGTKLVDELINSNLPIHLLISTTDWKANFPFAGNVKEHIECNKSEIKKISQLKTAADVIAIAEYPKYSFSLSEIVSQLTLVLDGIQDPGNLGTIVRLADWFGIKNIICSNSTVDLYNPKVVQATMGALLRVKVHYFDLADFFKEVGLSKDISVYGTYMQGENIYQSELPEKALIVMGNEGNGISSEVEPFITKRIAIPNFAKGQEESESLNVAVATGIILSEFKRQML